MPNRESMPPVYLQSGDPEAENNPTLFAPGQLGVRFTVIQPSRSAPAAEAGRSKGYQLVQTDSTMTVAPFVGAVAYWGDKTRYLVTTNSPSDSRGMNRLAGVFQNSVTPGNYCCVQWRGPGTVKLVNGVTQSNLVAGAYIVPSSTNAKADVVATATAPLNTPLGTVTGPVSFNAAALEIVVDLSVPETT